MFRFDSQPSRMKIYTRTGDAGMTGLFGGERVAKSHPRIEAYGTVDETNCVIGVVVSLLQGVDGVGRALEVLGRVQRDLFVLGADLATAADAKPFVQRVTADMAEALERDIDGFEGDLPALKNFILPGGHVAAAQLHLARTVCRRAERLTVEAALHESFNEHALVYLNRLSDLLFVIARWVNRQTGAAETPWLPDNAARG